MEMRGFSGEHGRRYSTDFDGDRNGSGVTTVLGAPDYDWTYPKSIIYGLNTRYFII